MKSEISEGKQIEIGEIKMHAIKKNYQPIIMCPWTLIMFALCMLFFGYTSNGHHVYKVGRVMLS
jgi:hypothetical protein